MKDENGEYVWRTIRGNRVKIYKDKTLQESLDIHKKYKEQYFKEHFYLESGDYFAEDLYNRDKKFWNDKKKAYDFKHGLYYKRINVIDKETGKEIANVRYKEVYKPKLMEVENKIHVVKIEVHPDYRRKGIATQLYKELQRRAGNEDIYFGEFTKDGKKLVESIGKITKMKKYSDTIEYWGRINK